ncbi:MAG: mersacidin/lichenicidin family type 2 lantibiotic [Acidobacteriota bacterium]
MKKIDTVRALRDAEYRNSLTEAERASLPAHPAGVTAVEDKVLQAVTGGCGTPTTFVFSCTPPNAQCP